MIRQAAFENKADKILKGALHCHTTRSDGKGDPADVIRLHKENGYDFLAITDHRKYNYKNFAPETDITIIPGMEFDNTFYLDNGFRTWHIVCIGPAKENGNGYEQDETMPSGKARNQEEFQKYLDEIHDKNNLTVYCHPEWSGTSAKYFERLQGNFAMEVWNTGCAYENAMDTNAAYWDELLGQGQRIFGVATDDGHPMSQHCKGWVMVNAENSIDSILEALKNGAFYSSTGPIINDFAYDGNTVHIECSEASEIFIHSDAHPTVRRVFENGTCSADITLKQDNYAYIRASVLDKNGNRAWTNPIWLK